MGAIRSKTEQKHSYSEYNRHLSSSYPTKVSKVVLFRSKLG